MKQKLYGLTIMMMSYIIAITVGAFSFILFNRIGLHYLVSILISDVIATIVIWLSGVIFKTASMYDPYWSIQTFIISFGLLFYFNNWNISNIIAIIVILIYSIRLTVNFIIGFDSLHYVDWRYKMLKEKSGHLYQIVNLFGICMFPTLVVYTASIPLFVFIKISSGFNPLMLIGSIIILFGTLLELVSDIQMKRFIKNRVSRSEVINVGLWNYSRHPNYLGEIIIWFGVAFILLIPSIQYWYLISGAIINLMMFIFISIPMEEKHMKEYKPKMDTYIKTVSPLLILPRKK